MFYMLVFTYYSSETNRFKLEYYKFIMLNVVLMVTTKKIAIQEELRREFKVGAGPRSSAR